MRRKPAQPEKQTRTAMRTAGVKLPEATWEDLTCSVTEYLIKNPGARYTVSDEIRKRLGNGKASSSK